MRNSPEESERTVAIGSPVAADSMRMRMDTGSSGHGLEATMGPGQAGPSRTFPRMPELPASAGTGADFFAHAASAKTTREAAAILFITPLDARRRPGGSRLRTAGLRFQRRDVGQAPVVLPQVQPVAD